LVALTLFGLTITAGAFAPGPALATVPGSSSGAVLPAEPGSDQDPAFVALKNAGRIGRRSDGTIGVLAVDAPALTPGDKSTLLYNHTGNVQEPKGSGAHDDNQVNYTDLNYWNLCGPGSAAVATYYFVNSDPFLLTIPADNYREPAAVLHRTTTYWKATDASSEGRGELMYLAEDVYPTGVNWNYSGIVKWEGSFPYGTPINRWRDGVNWVASGQTQLNYFYVIAKPANLTQAQVLYDVENDVAGVGVPILADVLTGDGTHHLVGWTAGSGINHSIAIIGYDNTVSPATYTYIDTCGPGCNDTGTAAGVHTIHQSAMWALIQAETDSDGIVW
jgi:hypothetical protein